MIATAIVALFAVVVIVLSRKSESASLVAVAGGWVGLIGGFLWLYFGEETDVATMISVALFGAFAGLVVQVESESARRIALTYVSVFVLSVATVVAMVSEPPVSGQFLSGQMLICAQWVGLFAFGGNLCASAALGNAETRVPLFFVISAFSAIGAIIAGLGRSSLFDTGYAFAIRSDWERVVYEMPPVRGFEQGAVLGVGAAAPNVFTMWIILALVGGFGALFLSSKSRAKDATTERTNSLSKYVAIAVAAVTAATAAVVSTAISNLSLPDIEPYKDAVKQQLLTKKLPGEMVDDAAFSGTENLAVAFSDLIPELFAIVFTAFCVVAFFVQKAGEVTAAEIGYRRDFFVRGVLWGWLAWMSSLVFHGTTFGTPGLMSASEWVFTGVALFSTGLLVVTWSAKNRVAKVAQDLAPGIAIGVFILGACFAYRFGAPFGLSLTVFR